jgi:hypothetical protein
MPTNFYETAREQACREIAVIDSNIQGLTHRKGQLEKLVALLSELESEPQQGSSAGVLPAALSSNEPIASEVPPAQSVQESSPESSTLAAHLERLHEYEQSQARIGVETTGAPASQEVSAISRLQIAQRAYQFWIDRGYAHGHHEEDWLRAEAEFRG